MNNQQLKAGVLRLQALQIEAEKANMLQRASIAQAAITVAVDLINELVKREINRGELNHG